MKSGVNDADDDFVRYACERYHKHHRIGEGIPSSWFFSKSDMTVADILYAYVQRANYTDVMTNWDGIGYCLHSDWALAYFASEYQITWNGHLEGYQNAVLYNGVRKGECRHSNVTTCNPNATICHYMTPEAMRERMKKNATNTSSSPIPPTEQR